MPDVPNEDGLHPSNWQKLTIPISRYDMSTFRHIDFGTPRADLLGAGIIPSQISASDISDFLFDVARSQQIRMSQVHARDDISDIMAGDQVQLYRTKTKPQLLKLVVSGMPKEVLRALAQRELNDDLISQLPRPEPDAIDKSRWVVYLGWLRVTIQKLDAVGGILSERFEYHHYLGSGTSVAGGIARIAQYVVWKCKAVEQGLHPNGKMTKFVQVLVRPCTKAAIRVLWSRAIEDVTGSEVIHVEAVMVDVLRAIPYHAVSEGGEFRSHSTAARDAYREVINALPPLKSESSSGLNGSSPYRQGDTRSTDRGPRMDSYCHVPNCTRSSERIVTVLTPSGKAKMRMCNVHRSRYRDGRFLRFKKVGDWLESGGPSTNLGLQDDRRVLDHSNKCTLNDCKNEIKYLIELSTSAKDRSVNVYICQFHIARWRECGKHCALETWEDFEDWRSKGAPTAGILRGVRRTKSQLAALGCDVPECEGATRETSTRFDSEGTVVSLHLCQRHASRLRSCIHVGVGAPVSAVNWERWVAMNCPTAGVWAKRDLS